MIIDIKEVQDYCFCPMLYKFNHEAEPNKDKLVKLRDKYDHDIHSCAYSFFALVQNEDVVSLSIIKRTWGTLWIGDKSASDLVFSNTSSFKETEASRRKKGIDTVINIYNKFKDKPGTPLMINKKYIVDIDKNIKLTGTFELVREVEYDGLKCIELMDFKTGDKFFNNVYVNKDLDITAASYAYIQSFGEELDRINFYGLDKNKMIFTKRDEEDYNMLKQTVKSVCICIKNNLFYAAPGNKCYDCIYKKKCVNGLKSVNMV